MIVVKTRGLCSPKNAENFSFSLVLRRNLNDLLFYCLFLFQVDLATELEQAKSQIMTHASEIAQVSGFTTLEKRRKLVRFKFRKDLWDCY